MLGCRTVQKHEQKMKLTLLPVFLLFSQTSWLAFSSQEQSYLCVAVINLLLTSLYILLLYFIYYIIILYFSLYMAHCVLELMGWHQWNFLVRLQSWILPCLIKIDLGISFVVVFSIGVTTQCVLPLICYIVLKTNKIGET